MATVVKYWDPDSAAGGDGTTTATAGANRAYHDYPELEAAEATDIDTDGDIFQARRSGTATDTVPIDTLTGWTTGASNYLQIMSNDGTRKKLVNSTNNIRILQVVEDYVRVEGFDFEQNQSASFRECIRFSAPGGLTSEMIVDNVRCSGAGTSKVGFNCDDGIVKLSNCAAFGNGSHGFSCITAASGLETYGRYCVAYNNASRGFNATASATADFINCYSGGNSSDDYDADTTTTNCASSDTTGDTGLQNIAASTSAGAYFTNLTAGSEDFHIDADNSALEDAGTDVPSVSLDAEGNTRHATTPDIGMYESVGGGPEDLPIPGKLINGNAITRAAYW